jgi:hypothetical protein
LEDKVLVNILVVINKEDTDTEVEWVAVVDNTD